MKKYYKTEAIIIKTRDLSEKDRIVTFLSPLLGKFNAVCKGGKGIICKSMGKMEPINLVLLMATRGQNLDTISQEYLVSGFSHIRNSLDTTTAALYMLDLVNKRVEQGEENKDLFNLLKKSLYMLESGFKPEIVNRAFDIKFVSIMGYMPEINNCLLCNRPGDFTFFSCEKGGIICPDCLKEGDSGRNILPGTVKSMRFLFNSTSRLLRSFSVDKVILDEMQEILSQYMQQNMPGQNVDEDKYKHLLN